MAPTLRKLTIVCPKALEKAIADALDTYGPDLAAYTCVDGRGRGSSMEFSTAREKVMGVMNTVVFMVVVPRDEIEPVLSIIKTACPTPKIAYWVELVEDYGRLQ